MPYPHKGKILDNGIVDFSEGLQSINELEVKPEDDGLHITDFNKGDFEWWYFDFLDLASGCFLKIVFHIGTDPLKTRIFPQIAISVNTPEGSLSITRSYKLDEIEVNERKCEISVKDNVRIISEKREHLECKVNINIEQFQCNFLFKATIQGWKPLGNEVFNQIGIKKSFFSWIIPMPGARVSGDFIFKEKKYNIQDATGYHDHNYLRVDPVNPLHLDELISKWYWGKIYAGDYTLIFMDTHCRTNRLISLMVAEKNEIIYSANNLMNLIITSTGTDPFLKAEYPKLLKLNSTDINFDLEAELKYKQILDRKDLLDGVNFLLKFIIKKFVARPAYFGNLASVKLKLNNKEQKGRGNYETMIFRD